MMKFRGEKNRKSSKKVGPAGIELAACPKVADNGFIPIGINT